jgi:hypothetical protein
MCIRMQRQHGSAAGPPSAGQARRLQDAGPGRTRQGLPGNGSDLFLDSVLRAADLDRHLDTALNTQNPVVDSEG